MFDKLHRPYPVLEGVGSISITWNIQDPVVYYSYDEQPAAGEKFGGFEPAKSYFPLQK